jgi:hypothetical protein
MSLTCPLHLFPNSGIVLDEIDGLVIITPDHGDGLN